MCCRTAFTQSPECVQSALPSSNTFCRYGASCKRSRQQKPLPGEKFCYLVILEAFSPRFFGGISFDVRAVNEDRLGGQVSRLSYFLLRPSQQTVLCYHALHIYDFYDPTIQLPAFQHLPSARSFYLLNAKKPSQCWTFFDSLNPMLRFGAWGFMDMLKHPGVLLSFRISFPRRRDTCRRRTYAQCWCYGRLRRSGVRCRCCGVLPEW